MFSMEARREGRLDWIDCVKGFAIILVMWGHVQDVSPLRIWIASFHVPIFLVCTGYLYAYKQKYSVAVAGLLKKLAIPYLVFSLFAIASQFVNAGMSYGVNQAIKTSVLNFYKTICGFGIEAIWFIPSYFIAVAAFFFLFKRGTKLTVVGLICFAFAGIGTEALLNILHAQGSSTFYNIISYPLLAVVRGLVCSIFIGGGMAYIHSRRKL